MKQTEIEPLVWQGALIALAGIAAIALIAVAATKAYWWPL